VPFANGSNLRLSNLRWLTAPLQSVRAPESGDTEVANAKRCGRGCKPAQAVYGLLYRKAAHFSREHSHPYFEHLGPSLAGDEDAVGLGIAGDAVGRARQQAVKWGHRPEISIQERTSPEAGEMRAIAYRRHTLAQISPWMNSNSFRLETGAPPSVTRMRPDFFECVRITEVERRRAIAHDEAGAIMRQTPAVRGIGETRQ